jgi:hypothetical protein
MWANGCSFLRHVLGESGWWKGVPYTALRPTPVAQAEAVATDGGRPGTFDGHLCNTPGTGWGPEYDGWMCDATYESSWKNYITQVNAWLQANVQNYNTRPIGIWNLVNEPSEWKDYTKTAYLCKARPIRVFFFFFKFLCRLGRAFLASRQW